jgi:hypothetical protein
MQSPLTFILIFLAALALLVAGGWLIRRFAGNRMGAQTNRGRMPRLAVIDAAAVDGRRRLVLVRRDNIEHLLMIGGPTDIVVEANIVRATAGRDPLPQRAAPGMEPAPRVAPLPDAAGWSDGELPRPDVLDLPEPQLPEPAPRPSRPAFAEEGRRAAAAPERRGAERVDRVDPLAGFAPEPLGGRPEARPELRGEPMPSRVTSRNEPVLRPARSSDAPKPPPLRVPPPSPPSQAASSADQNLAEMALRLEAALRRPGDAPDPRVGAPPVAPEPAALRPAPRVEPPAMPAAGASGVKSDFENLEDEMASLLGRPKTPS